MAERKNRVNSKEILRDIMNNSHVTYEVLKNKLGYRNTSGVSERVRADDIKLSTMVQFLSTMNYRVVIEPDSGRPPRDGCYIVREVKDETE